MSTTAFFSYPFAVGQICKVYLLIFYSSWYIKRYSWNIPPLKTISFASLPSAFATFGNEKLLIRFSVFLQLASIMDRFTVVSSHEMGNDIHNGRMRDSIYFTEQRLWLGEQQNRVIKSTRYERPESNETLIPGGNPTECRPVSLLISDNMPSTFRHQSLLSTMSWRFTSPWKNGLCWDMDTSGLIYHVLSPSPLQAWIWG